MVKIVVESEPYILATEIPLGHLCKARYSGYAIRTKLGMHFINSCDSVQLENCQEKYRDLGKLTIEEVNE